MSLVFRIEAHDEFGRLREVNEFVMPCKIINKLRLKKVRLMMEQTLISKGDITLFLKNVEKKKPYE